MRNLYKIILLLFTVSILAQDLQNANWALSDFGGLHFTPSTRTVFNSSLTADGFASASVSDQQGNLLFYTNGETVWDSGHSIMANGTGLLGSGGDFSQNIVIIPNPLDIDKYYIVTICLNEFMGQQYGLRYTEVDINTGVDPINKNIPLKDVSGTDIDSSYPANYGKITTASHRNGLDYWLIAEIGGKIYSYLVDDTGIHIPTGLPPFTSPLPSNFVIDIAPTTVAGNANSCNGPMRISPYNDRLLIGYSVASDGTNNITNHIPKLYVAFFDNNTGKITNAHEMDVPSSFIDVYLTGAEFAPDNITIHRFYEAFGISGTILSSVLPSEGEVWGEEEFKEPYNIPFARNLQRSIDGKIYFDNSDWNGTITEEYIGMIDTPSVDPYGVQFNVVDCGTSTTINSKHIPTWVQWAPCRRYLNTSNLITSAVNQEREVWIHATNKIYNSAVNRVVYHAGNHLELNPGFETQNDSKFVAYIENCSGNYVYKNESESVTQTNGNHGKPIKSFMVSPNPSKNFIDLTIKNDTFNKIIIAGIDGKIILDKTVEPTDSYNLDISRYASGVYIVCVVSNLGKQYSQKLIKN